MRTSRKTGSKVQSVDKLKQKFRSKPKEEGKRESILGAATMAETQVNI